MTTQPTVPTSVALSSGPEAEVRRELSSKVSQELDVGTLKSEVTALKARLQDADERAKVSQWSFVIDSEKSLKGRGVWS